MGVVGEVQVPKSPKGKASGGWWQVGGRRAKRTPLRVPMLKKSPAEDGKGLQPGHLSSRVASRCYLSVMTFASARASALLSSGIRIP